MPEALTGTIVERKFTRDEPKLPNDPISIYGQRFISRNGELRWILVDATSSRLKHDLWVGNNFEFRVDSKHPEIAILIQTAAPTVMLSLSNM
jgi:hypothetical protein